MLRFLFFISLVLVTAFPSGVFASLRFTEVMYDAEGSDDGYEWVELQNTSSSTIDISAYTFLENGTKHKLTPSSSSVLAPDAFMVIAQNPGNLESQGLLFKASFSLSNTGESLAILDPDGSSVDEIGYSSELGGAGDGLSLSLVDGSWVATEPTPGFSSSSENIVSSDLSIQSNTTSNGVKNSFEPYYDPYVTTDEVIVAHSPSRFRIGVFHVGDDARILELDGEYYVNFGDGSSLNSQERIDVDHIYPAPGSYLLTFEYYTSKLAQEAGEDPTVLMQKDIKVVAGTVTVVGTNQYGGLELRNESTSNLDLAMWRVETSQGSYLFPRYSWVRASGTITIDRDTLGFIMYPGLLDSVKLYNDRGLFVAGGSSEVLTSAPITSSVEVPVLDDQPQQEQVGISLGEGVGFLDEYVTQHPQMQEVSFDESSSEEKSSTSSSRSTIILLIGGIILSSLGFYGMKTMNFSPTHSSSDRVEGDIVEVKRN